MIDVEIDSRRARRLQFLRTLKPSSVLVRLIACHWKSQSGGEQVTEQRRILEAALLSSLLGSDPAYSSDRHEGAGPPPVLICGDLNEDASEFTQHGAVYQTALMPIRANHARFPAGTASPALFVSPDPLAAGIRPDPAASGSSRVVLFSPWLAPAFLSGFSSPGSYCHGGRWERLDQVLILSGGETAAQLTVVDHPDLLDSEGRPRRYDPRTGYGHSDHLPVMLHLEL